MSGPAPKYDPGAEVAGADVLCLHRNENLFVGREWSVDAARELVEAAAVSSYPDAGCLPLRRALGELYGVPPERVFVGNGADEVLSDLLTALRPTYDTFHHQDVCFGVYHMLGERLGFRRRALPGDTFETGRIACTGFRGLAVVDSPNAVTGTRQPAADILALAADPASFVIWDNVYGEYAGDELPDPLPANMAFVRSFSKFYGLAGLRIGYCIADAELVARMLAQKDVFNVNAMGQVMALEALRRRAYFEGLRDRVLECRRELVAGLTSLGFRVLPSDSVGVLATHPGFGAERLERELRRLGIQVRRFPHGATAEYVRVAVAPRPQLERLLAALREIVAG